MLKHRLIQRMTFLLPSFLYLFIYLFRSNVNQTFYILLQIYSWLSTLASSCRAGLTCQLYSIGNSYEGEPINVFKVKFFSLNLNLPVIGLTMDLRRGCGSVAGAFNFVFVDTSSISGEACQQQTRLQH